MEAVIRRLSSGRAVPELRVAAPKLRMTSWLGDDRGYGWSLVSKKNLGSMRMCIIWGSVMHFGGGRRRPDVFIKQDRRVCCSEQI